MACQEEVIVPPSNLIPEDKLVPLLADFHIVDAAAKKNLIRNNAVNKVKHEQYLGVLELHGFTKAEFDSTIEFHTHQPGEFKLIYEKVDAFLKSKKKVIQEE